MKSRSRLTTAAAIGNEGDAPAFTLGPKTNPASSRTDATDLRAALVEFMYDDVPGSPQTKETEVAESTGSTESTGAISSPSAMKLPENFHPAAYIDTDGHVDWDLLVSDSQSGLVGVAYLLFSFFESLEAVDTQHY